MAYIGGKKVGEAVRPAYFTSKTLTLSLPGRYFASLDNCDGYTQVYITATDMPSAMRQFVVGDPTVTTLTISNDVTKVNGCLQSFPNLSVFVATNTDQVVTFASNTFNGTKIGSGNGTIVVPNSLRTAYESAYPSFNFTSWVFEIEFTIPFIGETTLTKEYVETVAKNAGGNINIVTKVIVPPEFTEYESGSVEAIISAFTEVVEINIGCSGNRALKIEPHTIEWQAIFNELEAQNLDLGNSLGYMRRYENTTSLPSDMPILPPSPPNAVYGSLSNRSKLIYANLTGDFSGVSGGMFRDSVNAISIRLNGTFNQNMSGFLWSVHKLIVFEITEQNAIDHDTSSFHTTFNGLVNYIQEMYWENQICSLNYIGDTLNLTRDNLVKWFNKLGTPATQQTLNIGSNNLAKLTAEDKAIATAKNWKLT